jgi:hypothetical protein
MVTLNLPEWLTTGNENEFYGRVGDLTGLGRGLEVRPPEESSGWKMPATSLMVDTGWFLLRHWGLGLTRLQNLVTGHKPMQGKVIAYRPSK